LVSAEAFCRDSLRSIHSIAAASYSCLGFRV
jgi:hypothetical protein